MNRIGVFKKPQISHNQFFNNWLCKWFNWLLKVIFDKIILIQY